MSTTTRVRILRAVPIALAVVLSVGACGAGPSISGSGSMFGGSSAMSADDVGAYCKYSAQLYDPGSMKDYVGGDVDKLAALRPHTPSQLQSDIQLLQADYKAIADQRRVYAQLKGEVDPAYQRIKDFHDQICVAS